MNPEAMMSERTEVSGRCAGCGAATSARFCHECGQVAAPKLSTIRALVRDSFAEIASVDSRLVRSIRVLLTNPGRLSQAYLRGERSPYLSPAQLMLLAGVPAIVAATAVPRRAWGSIYDFTLQAPSDALGDWAVWGVLLVTAPLMAGVLAIMFARRRGPFTGHLVVSFHFFSAMLLLAAIQTALVPIAQGLPTGVAVLEWVGAGWALFLGVRGLATAYGLGPWPAIWRSGLLAAVYLAAYMWLANTLPRPFF